MLFPAQESDLERWDQLCGDGREDESKDGEIQDGGQIVKEENHPCHHHMAFLSLVCHRLTFV